MISVVFMLAAIGAAEAMVHAWRYRAAGEDSRAMAALSCLFLTLLRLGFIAGGVGAFLMGMHFLVVAAAYAGTASITTYFCHRPPNRESCP